jgi:hypothetical protein
MYFDKRSWKEILERNLGKKSWIEIGPRRNENLISTILFIIDI